MRDTLRLFVTIAGLALWQGGLTFYSLVVVPLANEMLPNGEQGFITQRVTNWLNLIGVLVLAILLANAVALKSRLFAVVWLVMAAAQVALFLLHQQLDQMLDPAALTDVNGQWFRTAHERYLIAVTVQWCAALVALWLLLHGPITRSPYRQAAIDDMS